MKRKNIYPLLVIPILLACNMSRYSVTPTPVRPVPESVLADVILEFEDCIARGTPEVVTEGDTYSFSCSNSADTYYSVSMTRFNSEASAHAQFESSRGENPSLCFHGYDLYETQSTNPNNQFVVSEQDDWQAGQWLVSIYASYDYGYYHYSTSDFSEAVYTYGVEHNLFPAGRCP